MGAEPHRRTLKNKWGTCLSIIPPKGYGNWRLICLLPLVICWGLLGMGFIFWSFQLSVPLYWVGSSCQRKPSDSWSLGCCTVVYNGMQVGHHLLWWYSLSLLCSWTYESSCFNDVFLLISKPVQNHPPTTKTAVLSYHSPLLKRKHCPSR